MKETPIKEQVMKWLKAQDIYAVKNIANQLTEPGRPDIFACVPTTVRQLVDAYGLDGVVGLFVGIENKATDKLGNVSEAQLIHMRHIERNGGIWFAANSLDMVKEVIECLIQNTA